MPGAPDVLLTAGMGILSRFTKCKWCALIAAVVVLCLVAWVLVHVADPKHADPLVPPWIEPDGKVER